MKKVITLLLGHLFLILGIVGAFLPVVPTTPFLLLAAYLYSKSSPQLHNWLINHKYLGPPLRDWHERGVIGIKSKIIATIMMVLAIVFRIINLEINFYIKALVTLILLCVLIFIWTRPSGISK